MQNNNDTILAERDPAANSPDACNSIPERWYDKVFRQSCDAVIEINLETGRYTRRSFVTQICNTMKSAGNYTAAFSSMLEATIVASDRSAVADAFHPDALKKAWSEGKRETSCQYRARDRQGMISWKEARAFFLQEEARPLVVITIRDVTLHKEQELKQSVAEQYDTALRNIYDELYELNITKDTYCLVYHSDNNFVVPRDCGRLHAEIEEIADKMIHADDRARFLAFFDFDAIQDCFQDGRDSLIGEFRKATVDGSYRWCSMTVFPIKAFMGDDKVLLCFIMDISDKKEATDIAAQNRLLKKQQLDNERYRIIVQQTGTIVFEWNLENDYRYISDKMSDTFYGDYHSGRDLFQIWKEEKIYHPEDGPVLDNFLSRMRGGARHCEMKLRLHSRGKGFIWCKVALTCLMNEENHPKRLIGTINDIDETVKSERELKYRAEFDLVTDIFNEQTFYSHAESVLEHSPDRKFAIVRMDIVRFKFINDIYGIEEGDRLLRFIAKSIQQNMRPGDVYGRMGSDIFCLCVSYDSEQELIDLTQRISNCLSSYGLGYKVVASYGICVVDDRTVPVSILCDWANLALKTVKGSLITQWAFYDDNLRAQQLDERLIENETDAAMAQGQFIVYLQPKHDLRTHRVVGAESLVRWNHPREGFLAPGRFIPLFERNGFIIRLDEFVWEETCRALRSWIDSGKTPVPVSMNVSRAHIYNPGFKEKIISFADKYRVPHSLVELELTESTFVENPDELYETMKSLQKEGFTFSMDDFGSGYSSLNMLKAAPVDTIKLDREFLNETTSTEKGRIIIEYTIGLAKRLNLHVVAEGVETAEQARFLMDAGCIVAQGYYFSKPMPINEFEKMAFPDPSAQ